MMEPLSYIFNPEGRKPYPAVDIYETKDNFEIKIDVPGFKKEDLELYISGSLLIIKDRKNETKSKDVKTHRRERSTCFERIFLFNATLEAEDVRVRVIEDGVLTLVVNRKDQKQIVLSKL
jgi:HSP20 family molecular chaperone IbpA